VSGRQKKPTTAMTKVTAPWRIKSHCQPAKPAEPSIPWKTPAAINPAKAVAKMLPRVTRYLLSLLCFLSLTITCVENGDTSGNLLAIVKDTQKVDSTRVVWCFCHTQEEANQKKTDKVMADGSETRYDSPQGHTSTHIVARFGPGEEHVLRKVSFYTFVCLERPETYRRDLSEKVTDEENADTGKILCLWSVLILMIEIGVCDLRVGVRLRSSSKSLRRARAMAFRSK
jgi:hypothetical protein